MAPSIEEWEALSPAERDAVVAALPGEITYDEMVETIVRVREMYDAAQRRAEEAERRRDEVEQENARLRAELERLRR